ncbi:IclR family transcriptional regulator [Actinomycetospora endophytica]|uniref:IclR family transcriptional regulator n=1 Tax=Actinomycetospora endophytica TaxID=2291215 RepID=A0ABS8P176_9PSEU|nr:IclR family transcriptional regulator [Actinomycetospora endophytica]MCD2192008.1 IclR family transcriptional regulator [Actinomycetospora endophytica]
MARSPSGESVLERVVRILEAFTPEAQVLGVGEVARRADLPVATASRMVADLVEHGLLTRESTGRVRMGTRLWELASRASPTLSMRELAMPVLEELLRAVGHHAQLGLLDGEEVLFAERLSAEGAVVNYTRIAARLPLHASSSGLVLLAHAPGDLQERILTGKLARFTSETITDGAELRRRLADIRREGFVLCAGHLHLEATGIAVPVRDETGHVVAAVSVIVPNDDRARGHVPLLTAGAREIQRRLRRAVGEADDIGLIE